MMPDKNTIFKPVSELVNYSDKEKYFCNSIVFSPETENNHFHKCPPYICIVSLEDYETEYYFEVPEIVAYYAVTHPCYTMKGIEMYQKRGEENFKAKLKDLLGCNKD